MYRIFLSFTQTVIVAQCPLDVATCLHGNYKAKYHQPLDITTYLLVVFH